MSLERQAESSQSGDAGVAGSSGVAGHGRLADRNAGFREFALATEEAQVRASFPTVAGWAERFTFPVQPWPTFVRRGKLAAWEAQAIALERLLKDVPRRLFDGDPAKLSRFYGLDDEALAALIITEPNGIDEALSRLDFIETGDGLKLLEINTGSYLGGWALTTLEEAYKSERLLAPFFAAGSAEVRSTPLAMMRHILRCLRDSPMGEGAERLDIGNLYTTGHLEDLLHRITGGMLNAAARQAADELGIDVPCTFHGVTESDLSFEDGCVYAGGIRLHAVVEQHDNLTSKELFRCAKTGRLHLYTGPATLFIGDKRNVALLYELRDSSTIFDEAEREVIRASVPWTHIVNHCEVELDGRWVYLPELLLAERERLVLKPALASSGVEVYLGRATSEERWREVVAGALEHANRWIVQELLTPPADLYQIGERGYEPCEMVWGLFALGGEPGGGYLRLNRRGGGPLNVGQGADVALYFAVEDDA